MAAENPPLGQGGPLSSGADNVQTGGSDRTRAVRIPPPLPEYSEPTTWSAGLGPAQCRGAKGGILETALRRLIDVFASSILLLLASPLFLITALAVWFTDRGDVFYRQTRAGLLDRPFDLVKFRSMRVNNLPIDDVTEIREDHALVTPVGRWIRRFKVDELPQLLNVLRGDMALIGPRPALPEQTERYTVFERRRLSVRPGMSGWAQVNGGIELIWPERMLLDVWYVDHRSLWLDLKILWLTAAVILFGEERNPKALQEAIVHANRGRGPTELDSPQLSQTTNAADGHSSGDVGVDRVLTNSRIPGSPQNHNIQSGGTVNARSTGDGRKAPRLCRVVHMTSVHGPFDGRIFHKECRSLAMAGYDVTIIAPRAEGAVCRDGINICAVTPSRKRIERMTRTIWKVYQAAVRENGDIYHFHDPELMPVGVLLKMRGKRVIYDVHEDYPTDVRNKHWIPTLLRGPASMAVHACEVAFTAAFDRVISPIPAVAKRFPAHKARVVHNYPWTHEFGCSDHLPYEKRDAIAVYVGGLSDDRGAREMRQAVELAAKEIPIRLVIAGWVNSGTKAEFERDGESRLVEYIGRISRSQVAELLARAKAGLVLFHPIPSYMNASPHKLFEYMAAGLPVVVSDLPHWREMITSAGCGLLADPLNPAAIAEALVWLFRHPAEAAEMGRNSRRAVVEKYNWESEAEGLIATYAELQPA